MNCSELHESSRAIELTHVGMQVRIFSVSAKVDHLVLFKLTAVVKV